MSGSCIFISESNDLNLICNQWPHILQRNLFCSRLGCWWIFHYRMLSLTPMPTITVHPHPLLSLLLHPSVFRVQICGQANYAHWCLQWRASQEGVDSNHTVKVSKQLSTNQLEATIRIMFSWSVPDRTLFRWFEKSNLWLVSWSIVDSLQRRWHTIELQS